MRGDLHHLLAGIRMRCRKPDHQRIVKPFPMRVGERNARGVARGEGGCAKGAHDGNRARP